MNKLISTDLNGFPFVLDDLRFIDNGIRNAFKGCFDALIDSSYTNDGFLLDKNKPSTTSPAFIDEATPNFPETFCYINGEIFLISPTTLDFTSRSNGDAYCIETDFSFDGDGTKVFEDTNTHETYQIRKAKLTLKLVSTYTTGTDIPVLVFDDSGSNRFVYAQVNTYFGRLAYKLDVMDIELINAVFSGQITSLQNSRNNSESAWTTINSSNLYPKIYINSTANKTDFSSDIQLQSLSIGGMGSDSFLKFKKVGRTLHVSFSLVNLFLPEYGTSTINPVMSINIDLTGLIPSLTNILDFKSVIMGTEIDWDFTDDRCISGSMFTLEAHRSKPMSIVFYGYIPSTANKFYINESYDHTANPMTATSRLDTHKTRWIFEGSFTCEIN